MKKLHEKIELAHPDAVHIRSFFNSISKRYDFLNSLLSIGQARYWRKQLLKKVDHSSAVSVLDLGAGTGSSLRGLTTLKSVRFAVGCDFSEEMLRRAKRSLAGKAELINCDFHFLPFQSASFDLVTGSFILRSVQNLPQFLLESIRVLRPHGKVLFLELTRPKARIFHKVLFQPYLKWVVPFIGKLVSRHDDAYYFLSESVAHFKTPEDLLEDFKKANFRNVWMRPLSGGITTLLGGEIL